MTTSVTIDCKMVDPDRPIEVLGDLIAKRVQFIKGETTEKAVIATSINVVTSIRSDTKVAKWEEKKISKDAFAVALVEANARSFRGARNARKLALVVGGRVNTAIRPVNLMYGIKGPGNLYKITITNQNLAPKKSLNSPFYYVLAQSIGIAENYARSRVSRALRKEAGMAKYALGVAQAKISDRPMTGEKPTGSKPMAIAYASAVITTAGSGVSSGDYSLTVKDDLNYSALALKSGERALEIAMMKAANRTAAIINRLGDVDLRNPIQTPFPEVKGRTRK